jgi:RHH-type proline utilization regulon transcriptional repressor/proline dehydrogenase/delta 1-pyrroline-5-carboxylate dehydrogenase
MLEEVSQHKQGFFWNDFDAKMMDWAMRDERLKVQLFRFVDVLPMLKTPEDVLHHLHEYLDVPGLKFPGLGLMGLNAAASIGLGRKAVAAAVTRQMTGMARKFIAGSDIKEAAEVLQRLRQQNMASTVDIIGEVTVSEEEGKTCQEQYLTLISGLCEQAKRWPANPRTDTAAGKPIPRVNISIKLSALSAQFEPADPEGTTARIKHRLQPILDRAREHGAFLNIDMEHYAIKDATLGIFRDLIMDPRYREWEHMGIVLQTYLRDAEKDARELIELAKLRKTPIVVRLVRGAYWDYETVLARQRNWPIPVWTEKHDTDLCFEKVADLLLENYPHIQLAVASHNLRSIAHVMARAEGLKLPKDAVEYQMLYGMGDPLKRAVLEQGQRLRIYTPFGELIPGMAYFVRRLLENTANESFLRQGFMEKVSPEELLRDPHEAAATARPIPSSKRAPESFVNEPDRNYSLAAPRVQMHEALVSVRRQFGQNYPLLIGGKEVSAAKQFSSLNPARPAEILGGVSAASLDEAEAAIIAAKKAFPAWRDTSPEKRAEVLFKAAQLIAEVRDELAAWMVYEVGKNWREADADVCEAIDFLRYYAAEAVRLGSALRLAPVAGETNDYFYEPKGVVVVIPPWNFPLAICAGMTSAAIAAGNSVVLKPASFSPIIAAKLVHILCQAGLPDGVINFVPGMGGEIGDVLVQHPDTQMIAFTGSREIGCRINRLAAEITPGQQHLKRVLAEMGGKNAIIVDADADLDEAVLGTVQSAFGFQGQKCSACSRVIVLESVYEQFVHRIVEATRSLVIGPPEHPASFMGPVVAESAKKNILRYIGIGKTEATLAFEQEVAQLGDGYYVSPTIFSEVPPKAIIAQEEIFGPVLSVLRAKDLEAALQIALDTDYALTGGIYSRSPANIARARKEYRVGNLYINRKITGAIVARQPFGGFRLSGTGSKAGGPDYLLQFLNARTITENSLRRGFAPEES